MSIVTKQREPLRLPIKTEAELDKISNLPGHVIDQILSHLPIRDAVRTSVLSRKWRYKWATIPYLVFDNQCLNVSSQDQTFIKNKLVNIIDHVLLLHKGPLHKFKLSHRDLLGVTDIDRWILCLSRSSIKEFILEIWKGQRYKPPSCLFNCQNLIHLELFNCLLKPPLTFKGFKNLRSLDLQHITIIQNVFENLISSCPLLERLTLMNFTGVTHLNIDAPNLQFFDIGGIFDDVSFQNTVHLALVSIGLYVNIDNEENNAEENSSKLLRFFVNLPHIRRLEVQSYFLKYLAIGSVPSRLPNPCVDLNYLSIRIDFEDLEENIAAQCLLRSCPNLQELEMLARPEEQNSVETSSNFWEDDHWSSLFAHLRLVKVSGISGVKSEMDFIKFLLSNSPVLERLTVKPASQDGEWELMKELLRFRRASIYAEVIYLDP
ncbi:F-box/FBD/LRR-repeat protein At1g13570-like [Herrania umbratica]|uniref:F-box/FBD/LRR-repeat protein At1g13570-like n=1 Tax=Herrania umbratica TaxID=108875 RepID=A0A6J1ADK4_9ROSI|nr:F-box/FBD/LRR-repeat protein At1g13570-like [Herrania umbratica]